MGQDIHLTVEYRHDQLWYPEAAAPHAEFIFIWRDYSVFNTLVATARGEVDKSICETGRGLPPDMHSHTRALFDNGGVDLHTHSWITGGEFDEFFPWNSDARKMSHFAIVGHAIRYQHWSPQRFIFAFDN